MEKTSIEVTIETPKHTKPNAVFHKDDVSQEAMQFLESFCTKDEKFETQIAERHFEHISELIEEVVKRFSGDIKNILPYVIDGVPLRKEGRHYKKISICRNPYDSSDRGYACTRMTRREYVIISPEDISEGHFQITVS